MAELLSYMNSRIGKYTINDIINNNIAIRSPTLESFISIQNKIKKRYKHIKTIDYECYNFDKDKTCISINNSETHMLHCDINSYKRYNFIIIDVEDILF